MSAKRTDKQISPCLAMIIRGYAGAIRKRYAVYVDCVRITDKHKEAVSVRKADKGNGNQGIRLQRYN